MCCVTGEGYKSGMASSGKSNPNMVLGMDIKSQCLRCFLEESEMQPLI